MNIHVANMFDSRKLNLRLFTNAIKLDKQETDSYTPHIELTRGKEKRSDD